jgi:chorismate mutase
MSTYAFAQSVVKPTQETAAFINRLNALVDETNALYNQRIAQARAVAAKKQEGDKPATDSDSPSEI